VDALRVAGSELVNKLAEVLAGRSEILEAYLFGSQARGTAQAHSDIDVAVYVDPASDLDPGFGMDAEISADLMSVLGRNDIDVAMLNRAGTVLYHREVGAVDVWRRPTQVRTRARGADQSKRRRPTPELLARPSKSFRFLVTRGIWRDTAMAAMRISPTWCRCWRETLAQISAATLAASSSNGRMMLLPISASKACIWLSKGLPT